MRKRYRLTGALMAVIMTFGTVCGPVLAEEAQTPKVEVLEEQAEEAKAEEAPAEEAPGGWTPADPNDFSSPYRVEMDVPYLEDGSEFHLLDVFDATGKDTKEPLLIEIHGGGLIGGSKQTNLMHSDYYCRNGFKVLTPNYTLMPAGDYRTIVRDLFSMLAWTQEHADEYGYDLDHAFLSGDSAGGYIVTLLAAVLTNEELQAYYEVEVPEKIHFCGFILTCPMADQEDLIRALDGKEENFLNSMIFAPAIGEEILRDEDLMSHAILFNIIKPETFPEVYIITTPDGGDPYYRDAVMLKDYLEQNQIPFEYHEYSEVVHPLGHVFNIDNDKMDFLESRMANDQAIAYMLLRCKD